MRKFRRRKKNVFSTHRCACFSCWNIFNKVIYWIHKDIKLDLCFDIRNNLFTYNWYISFCREKRVGKIVSMFPPKYLPFSSYIISPFLIIFSLSLHYYLSPPLSFPTSIIISLFSFHPLIIYLPSLIFSFLQQSQKEVFHLPKKIRFGYIIKFIDLWIGLQIFTFLQTRILCLCECTLSICLDHNKESRSLIKTKQKYCMGVLF